MCFDGRNQRIINELDSVIGDEVPESDGFPNPKLIAPQRLGPRGHPGGALFVTILLLVGVSAMSCKGKSNPAGPGPTADEVIQIAANAGSNSYVPSPDTVIIGMKVAWHNSAGVTHTATADPGAPAVFNTGNVGNGGDSGVITMSTAGTYNYHCSIHPTMTGRLVVLP